VSQYQKGKTNVDFTEARAVSGSGISWAICKSAHRSRQITTPAPHHSVFFTGRMPFLPPNQQCQSTEGISVNQWFVNDSEQVLCPYAPVDHYDAVSTFHDDNILQNALFDALHQLSGTHCCKLFSVVTLLQFLSLD